jgi:hypothetical protein
MKETNADRAKAALRQAGVTGMLTQDMQVALGVRVDSATQAIATLSKHGLVGSWPDPYGRCLNRMRYWLAEYRPAKCPPPSGVPLRDVLAPPAAEISGLTVTVEGGVRITRHVGAQCDLRYQVPPGAQVYGCGFAAIGIGRDINTGRAWA